MQSLDGEDSDLFEKLGAISSDSRNLEVESVVTSILKKVSDEGDAGLLSFTLQFDRASLTSAEQCVTPSEFNVAEEALQFQDRTLTATKLSPSFDSSRLSPLLKSSCCT